MHLSCTILRHSEFIVENRKFSYPCVDGPLTVTSLDFHSIFICILALEKDCLCYHVALIVDNIYSDFDRTLTCDRHIDGNTKTDKHRATARHATTALHSKNWNML